MFSCRVSTAIFTSRVYRFVLGVGLFGFFLYDVCVLLRVQVRITCCYLPLCDSYYRAIRGPFRDHDRICVCGAQRDLFRGVVSGFPRLYGVRILLFFYGVATTSSHYSHQHVNA